MAGIYLHIPFCKQACYYCDFHFSTSLKHKEALLQAIKKELILRKKEWQNQTVETIYFGGGTPSLLSTTEIENLLETVFHNFNCSNTLEITLEANPDDLTSQKIRALATSSINRLSIGVQSFSETDLQYMNRSHSAQQAKKVLDETLPVFPNSSIDLIYGLPSQSIEKWNKNLEIAMQYAIPHISSYALTVEPKTPLHRFIKTGKYLPLNDTLAENHFHHLVEFLEHQNYIHYEISNFGKKGTISKHNTSYWQGKNYLGIGPSAHSYINPIRSWNVANNLKYISKINENKLPNTKEKLTKNNRFNETIMLGLRTIWGVNLNEIKLAFGSTYHDKLLHKTQKYINENLLEILELPPNQNQKIIRATAKGKFLIDGIAAQLFTI